MHKEYFVYDNMMCRSSLLANFDEPRMVDMGYVHKAKLAFMGDHTHGRASLLKTDQCTDYVPGVIIRLSESDADMFEQAYKDISDHYKKVKVEVYLRSGKIAKYACFVLVGDTIRREPPIKEYFWAMIQAYNERKLDKTPLYAALITTVNNHYEIYDDVGAMFYIKPVKAKRGGRPEHGTDIRTEVSPDGPNETSSEGAG